MKTIEVYSCHTANTEGQNWWLTISEEEAVSIDPNFKLATLKELHNGLKIGIVFHDCIIHTSEGDVTWFEDEEEEITEYRSVNGYSVASVRADGKRQYVYGDRLAVEKHLAPIKQVKRNPLTDGIMVRFFQTETEMQRELFCIKSTYGRVSGGKDLGSKMNMVAV